MFDSFLVSFLAELIVTLFLKLTKLLFKLDIIDIHFRCGHRSGLRRLSWFLFLDFFNWLNFFGGSSNRL